MDEEISFPLHFSFQMQNFFSISEQGPAPQWDWLTNDLCSSLGSTASPPPASQHCVSGPHVRAKPGMDVMLQAECSGATGSAQVPSQRPVLPATGQRLWSLYSECNTSMAEPWGCCVG